MLGILSFQFHIFSSLAIFLDRSFPNLNGLSMMMVHHFLPLWLTHPSYFYHSLISLPLFFSLSVMPFYHSYLVNGKTNLHGNGKIHSTNWWDNLLNRMNGIFQWIDLNKWNAQCELTYNQYMFNQKKIYSYNRKNLCCKRKYSTKKTFWKFFSVVRNKERMWKIKTNRPACKTNAKTH